MPSWGGAAAGAGTGAAIGSVVPILGTGVGAGVGGLIGGLFGGGGKDDKAGATSPAGANPIDFDAITQALQKSAAGTKAKGQRLGADGEDALTTATNYFKALAGGADTTINQARKGMVVDQYDTARKSSAEFDGRGGGTTAASAMSRISQANQIADLNASGRTEGASALAGLGATEAGLELTADQLASADLGTLIQASLGQQQIASAEGSQNKQTAAGLAQGLGLLLGMYLTRGKGAQGAAP